ncbi:hypothetical protein B0J14DRAFT_570617 [Halenospora varia]|nr:hypothetical protein B0J14DRAFT_570617 [Halenospora varia]
MSTLGLFDGLGGASSGFGASGGFGAYNGFELSGCKITSEERDDEDEEEAGDKVEGENENGESGEDEEEDKPNRQKRLCESGKTIAHLDFASFPATLSLDKLRSLAVLCDQYDCVKLVKPWIQNWLDGANNNSGEKTTPEDLIFIAWVFGSEALNSSERLLEPMPFGLMESILSVRRSTIIQRIGICHNIINIYAKKVCTQGNDTCTAIIFGSAIQPMTKLGLWPPEKMKTEKYLNSVKSLATPLRNLRILVPDTARGSVSQSLTMVVENLVLISETRHRKSGIISRALFRIRIDNISWVAHEVTICFI